MAEPSYLSSRNADVDLRQLRYLVTIIDCGSLSKAAEQVHIAQPALSQQMAALESELQVRLLLRSSQGVKASTAGKALYRHARAVLRQLEHAREEVTQGGVAESGRVGIGLPTSAARVLAMPLFKRIRAKYPGIFLQIFESLSGYLAELLANNRFDMAILFRDTSTRGISVQPLVEEDLFLVGDIPGTNLSEVDSCPMRLLDSIPLVLPSHDQGLRLLVERSFAQADLELNVIADIDSLPTLISAAREGLACTILARSALMSSDHAQRLHVRRLVEPGIRRPVSLCWSNSLPRTSAAIAVQQTAVDLAQELVRDQVWGGARLLSTGSALDDATNPSVPGGPPVP